MTENTMYRIDNYMQELLKKQEFNGSILVSKGDDIAICKSYGMANYEWDIPNTPDTKFCIASITKSITAMAVLMLAEKNRLRIEDTLNMYIPDYPNGDRITIHHLLTHTSGIFEINKDPEKELISNRKNTLEGLIERFKYKELDFEPGERFEYCNSGYLLLSYIIEKVSGRKYHDFIRENIFDRLLMKDTGCFVNEEILKNKANGYIKSNDKLINVKLPDLSMYYGAGNLYSTVKDTYIWTKALANGQLLTREYNNKLLAEYGFIEDTYCYGYGKIICKKDNRVEYLYQDGGMPGYRSIYMIYPQKDLTFIIFSNNYSANMSGICEKLEQLVQG